MKNFQNFVAEIFLFFGILFMFLLSVTPYPYWIVLATFSVIFFVFSVVLYKPERKEAKAVDLKEEEVLRLLKEFEKQDRQRYANKQHA